MVLISFWLAKNQHSLLWTALEQKQEFSKNPFVELNFNTDVG
jgi:hypothetical protein